MSIANGVAKGPTLRDRLLGSKPRVQIVTVEGVDFGPIYVRCATLEDRIKIGECFKRAKDGGQAEKQEAMAVIAATLLCDVHGDQPFDSYSKEDVGLLAERIPAHVVDTIIEQGLEFNGMAKKKESDSGKVPSEPTPNSA
jgi:hypothetical protein